MSDERRRSRITFVDSRSPRNSPLREILGAAAEFDVEVVAADEHAIHRIVVSDPDVVLAHADSSGGPEERATRLITALCRAYRPRLPMLLYRSKDSIGHEEALSRLGIDVPVIAQERLTGSLEGVVHELFERSAARAALEVMSKAHSMVDERITGMPPGFRVAHFLEQVEHALVQAAIREHPDRTEAAAALRIRFETFLKRLNQHSLRMPRGRHPPSLRGQRLLWCSQRPTPRAVAAACEAMDLDVKPVLPGALQPRTILSVATIAAIVEPTDAGSAIDAWLLRRSIRPYVLSGPPIIPVQLLLEQLQVVSVAVSDPIDALQPLIRVGRSAASLHADEDTSVRLRFRPEGRAAWPIDVAKLRRALRKDVLSCALRLTGSTGAAAEAVGLEVRTFQRWLRTGPE